MRELLASPLLWLFFTLAVYESFRIAYERFQQPIWLQPMLWSLVVIVSVLVVFQVDYAVYFAGTQFLHFLLGPATVALAVPLYLALPHLKRAAMPLLTVLCVGSIVGVLSALWIAEAFALSDFSWRAFATRAVTTPIAIGVAEKIEAPIALVAAIVGISGLFGAMMAPLLLRGIRSDVAYGFALGLGAHGVGTAFAFQRSATAGAFAALGMSLNGLLTAFWLPWAIRPWL